MMDKELRRIVAIPFWFYDLQLYFSCEIVQEYQ